MNLQGIGPQNELYATSLMGRAKPKPQNPPVDIASTPKDRPEVSDAARVFSRLHQLQQKDPEKFQQVTSKIAERLSEVASRHDGPSATVLQGMAELFAQASKQVAVSTLTAPSAAKGPMPGLSVASGQVPPAKGIQEVSDLIISSLEEAGA